MAQKVVINGGRVVVTSDEMAQLAAARTADFGSTVKPLDIASAATVADLLPVLARLITKVNKLEAEITELRSRNV